MSRRVFLQSLVALLGGVALSAMAQTKPNSLFKPLDADWKILQVSPVAGFQYYQGEALWPQLAAGQPIPLIRETGNPYDKRAVLID
ncbi:MAG TPA: hypothetical protein DEO56_05200 [Nitrosomonas nitrosa]|nr:hypothetical protein [Nitrosomonas nitrosa]HNP52825.1 hypothetical protein [Nitrosomonas nitrosa]